MRFITCVKKACLITLMCSISNSFASVIDNGDFSTCDYSSWNTDTDGGSGSINDFTIKNNGSTCSAQLQVDHFTTAGDPFSDPINDGFFINTLSQSLDFTGADTSTWLLSIDFAVDSEITSADPLFIADSFSFGLTDGLGGYFNDQHIDGYLLDAIIIDGAYSDIITFELAESFSNVSGLFLDIAINIGTDFSGWPDGYGSTLLINEVSLVEKLADITKVPEPSTLLIFLTSLVALTARKNKLF